MVRGLLLRVSVFLLLALSSCSGGSCGLLPEGTTPDQFFAKTQSGRPRALFMIGLSGSGKSSWGKAAGAHGWVHIDSDEMVLHELDRLAARREVAPEIGAVPNPLSSEHFFKLRFRGQAQARMLLEQALARRMSIVWDSLGLNSLKTELAAQLHAQGYEVWWLIFHAEGIERNRYNLFVREARGGFGSFTGLPREARCRALNRMLETQLSMLQGLEREVSVERPPGVDRIFRVPVVDLRPRVAVTDPCLSEKEG